MVSYTLCCYSLVSVGLWCLVSWLRNWLFAKTPAPLVLQNLPALMSWNQNGDWFLSRSQKKSLLSLHEGRCELAQRLQQKESPHTNKGCRRGIHLSNQTNIAHHFINRQTVSIRAYSWTETDGTSRSSHKRGRQAPTFVISCQKGNKLCLCHQLMVCEDQHCCKCPWSS